jgi:hypothetical protein
MGDLPRADEAAIAALGKKYGLAALKKAAAEQLFATYMTQRKPTVWLRSTSLI